MNSETATRPRPPAHQAHRHFAMGFSSTPRDARLAGQRLDA
ncbi:hypothetical protein ACFYWY_11080 [Streptomyces sp. NPDC002870]